MTSQDDIDLSQKAKPLIAACYGIQLQKSRLLKLNRAIQICTVNLTTMCILARPITNCRG
jgi:hypothetical protein